MLGGSGRPYTLAPLPVFGAEITGIDLKGAVSEEVVQQIKEDVTRCAARCRRAALPSVEVLEVSSLKCWHFITT